MVPGGLPRTAMDEFSPLRLAGGQMGNAVGQQAAAEEVEWPVPQQAPELEIERKYSAAVSNSGR